MAQVDDDAAPSKEDQTCKSQGSDGENIVDALVFQLKLNTLDKAVLAPGKIFESLKAQAIAHKAAME